MQTLATGCLAKCPQSHLAQTLADFKSPCDDCREFHIWRRIQIKHQTPGHLRIIWRAVPGMHLERADLRDSGKRFDSIDLHVRRLIAFDLRQGEEIRNAGHRMALEELLAAYAVRRTQQRARSATQMRQQPFAHRLVVCRQIELGNRLTVPRVRPQLFVGFRDRNAHDDRGQFLGGE